MHTMTRPETPRTGLDPENVKHYAMVVVVEADGRDEPTEIWEETARWTLNRYRGLGTSPRAVYLSDPHEVKPPASDYATQAITLHTDDGVRVLTDSALEA